jgi:hypothetical protein
MPKVENQKTHFGRKSTHRNKTVSRRARKDAEKDKEKGFLGSLTKQILLSALSASLREKDFNKERSI